MSSLTQAVYDAMASGDTADDVITFVTTVAWEIEQELKDKEAGKE